MAGPGPEDAVNMTLTRRWFTERSTIGVLTVDSLHECYALEDQYRPGDIRVVKVAGRTAIPLGRYRVVLDFSPRFGTTLTRLLDVPGFDGIRIHAGNTDADTEGCILVGTVREPDRILASRVALDALMAKIRAGLLHGECWIEIKGEPVAPGAVA